MKLPGSQDPTQSRGKMLHIYSDILFYTATIPGVGEDFAGADRGLEEGARVEETFPLMDPLWIPVLPFPEPDFSDFWAACNKKNNIVHEVRC